MGTHKQPVMFIVNCSSINLTGSHWMDQF